MRPARSARQVRHTRKRARDISSRDQNAEASTSSRQGRSVADIHVEEFRGRGDERSGTRTQGRVILEDAGGAVRGKFHKIGYRREVSARISVKSPVRVGRHVVMVRARRSGGTDALRTFRTV